jgi:hypothetical protein
VNELCAIGPLRKGGKIRKINEFVWIIGLVGFIGIILFGYPLRAYTADDPEHEAWVKAVTQNSIDAYAEYVKKFPNSPRGEELKKRIDTCIVSRVEKEVKEHGLRIEIDKKDFRIGGLSPGAIYIIKGGELNFIRKDITFLSDPTDELETAAGLNMFSVTKGRGIMIVGNDNVVYVFGVDVSSVISTVEKPKR